MTQEEKQLVFKDLCARLPYGVKVKVFDESILMESINNEKGTLDGKETMSDDCFVIKCKIDSWIISCEDFKPYLRTMSSMTKEEKDELFQLMGNGNDVQRMEFYHSHHLDCYGMIGKGLALEAQEGMYKNE